MLQHNTSLTVICVMLKHDLQASSRAWRSRMDRSRIERLQAALRGPPRRLGSPPAGEPGHGPGLWPMNGLSYGLFTAEAGPVGLVAPPARTRRWTAVGPAKCSTSSGRSSPETIRERPFGRAIGGWAKRFKLSRADRLRGRFRVRCPGPQRGRSDRPCEGSRAWLKSLLPRAAWRDATALLNRSAR